MADRAGRTGLAPRLAGSSAIWEGLSQPGRSLLAWTLWPPYPRPRALHNKSHRLRRDAHRSTLTCARIRLRGGRVKASRLGKPSCPPRQARQVNRRGQFTRPLRPDSKSPESWTSAKRPRPLRSLRALRYSAICCATSSCPAAFERPDCNPPAVTATRHPHVRGALPASAPAPATRLRATRSSHRNRAA